MNQSQLKSAVLNSIIIGWNNQSAQENILINGDWGIGKTFVWEQIEQVLREKNIDVIRISLFGINKIDGVDLEIKKQIKKTVQFANSRIAKTVLDFLNKLAIPNIPMNGGEEANAILSTLATIYLDNIDIPRCVICIDDIERISKDIKLEDVLGYIDRSLNNCIVVLIGNESQLENSDNSYSKFKEKVIDREFYLNEIDDVYSSIVEKYRSSVSDVEKKELIDILKKHQCNNLRNAIKTVKYISQLEQNKLIINEEILNIVYQVVELLNKFNGKQPISIEMPKDKDKDTVTINDEEYPKTFLDYIEYVLMYSVDFGFKAQISQPRYCTTLKYIARMYVTGNDTEIIININSMYNKKDEFYKLINELITYEFHSVETTKQNMYKLMDLIEYKCQNYDLNDLVQAYEAILILPSFFIDKEEKDIIISNAINKCKEKIDLSHEIIRPFGCKGNEYITHKVNDIITNRNKQIKKQNFKNLIDGKKYIEAYHIANTVANHTDMDVINLLIEKIKGNEVDQLMVSIFNKIYNSSDDNTKDVLDNILKPLENDFILKKRVDMIKDPNYL